jgi:hypothetical protein
LNATSSIQRSWFIRYSVLSAENDMRVIVFPYVAAVVSMIGPYVAPVEVYAARNIVTAAQVNGTWRGEHGEFNVWALGQQRLRVAFSGTYEYSSPYGPMANVGEGVGIAIIESDTAVFKPDGAEDECKIVLRFAEDRLVVDQDGICGFGHNVSAAGTYRKISRRKPKFDID